MWTFALKLSREYHVEDTSVELMEGIILSNWSDLCFTKLRAQVPGEYTGAIVDLLSRRKGEMITMSPADADGEKQMTNIEYIVPTRGMIGLRNAILTATRGTAVMDTTFNSYKPFAGWRHSVWYFRCHYSFHYVLVPADDAGVSIDVLGKPWNWGS